MTFFIAAFVPLWDRTRYCCISWKRTAAFNPYLIVLCRQYGLKGIGIEQESERVQLSRKALDKLGLSDRIKIIHGNHLTLPLETKSDLICDRLSDES